MKRCNFCGEVLEGSIKYCPSCGKNVNAKPSKRYLKKQEKKNKVNYDARLYRLSYAIFAGIFILVGLVSAFFYAHYFLTEAFGEEVAYDYFNAVNFGDIWFKVNELLPFLNEKGEISFVFIIAVVSLSFSLISLFTKRFSWGAFFYKLSAIFGILSFICYLMIYEHVPFNLSDDFVGKLYDNQKNIIITGAALSGTAYVLGIVFSFHFSNPYRPTLYQWHKALYWCYLITIKLLYVMDIDLGINLELYFIYGVYLMPAFIFIGGILLLVGKKYRGNINKLK